MSKAPRGSKMPAIITHHIFGQDASALLPEGCIANEECLLAFLLGNQGTDPLWVRFSTLPHIARACHALAGKAHTGHVVDAFFALRDGVAHLPEQETSVGRAYVLGVLAHYLLDSVCHPLIIALVDELVTADPSLNDARPEIHALIESDIDSWMLWQKRQLTVCDTPCAAALASTPRICDVAGTLLAHMAKDVYGIRLAAAEFGHAVRDYRLVYRLIDPPAPTLTHALARIETIWRPHSRALAQAHRVPNDDELTLGNLEHHLWHDPATGDASTASIADLFHDCLLAWPMFARRFLEGDRARVQTMVAGINYYGVPVE